MPAQPATGDVVAVAILRHGMVLAAQRSYPPETAGRWELPGGKAQSGETRADAARREIREELGCEVEPHHELDGVSRISSELQLVALTATLPDNATDPTAHEHQAIRWVAPEELDSLDWLEQDRVFLGELRELLLDGEPLAGGATEGASRVGDTVRRPTGRWTPSVHRLLDHLSGVPGVPSVLGIDERGREVLSYIEGSTIRPDDETLTDEQVASCAAMLRGIHDAMATFRPAGTLPWRYGERELDAGEVICHNDPGVYNWAFDGERAAGLFDWDMAGPGDPIDDLAFLAWTAVPLYRDIDPVRCAERLRLLASAYGGIDPADLLPAAQRRMTTAAKRIAAGIERGDPGMTNLARVGEPERTRARLRLLAEHTSAIASHLARMSG